ncbi:MAG: MFS transporter, partial [Planctomycetota bacterium]
MLDDEQSSAASPTPGRQPAFFRAVAMLALVLAGEAIFFLPFHITRHFRPTFVQVFGIGQDELGAMQALYGIVAAFAYLVGGGFADSIQPRKLLAGSLVVTGLSGLYLATIPSSTGLYCLYAFWGASTIVPFWSALIRATRDWGDSREQGAAFGVLDGGRGLMAALLGACALWLFALCFPGGIEAATPEQRVEGLRYVILTYTAACFVAAVSAYSFVSPSTSVESGEDHAGFDWPKMRECFAMPAVWLQAGIIVAAYTIFKGRDFYTQYAYDVWGWSEMQTAHFSTVSTWVRPVAAVGAGLLADRWLSTRVIALCFT